jgi:hypothetical protein
MLKRLLFATVLCAMTLSAVPAFADDDVPDWAREDAYPTASPAPDQQPSDDKPAEETPKLPGLPSDMKGQLPASKPGDAAAAARLMRIATSLKKGGKASPEDLQFLRTYLKSAMSSEDLAEHPEYAGLFEQLDSALDRLQNAKPDGGDDDSGELPQDQQ